MKTRFLILFLSFAMITVNAQLTNPADKDKKANLDKEFIAGSNISINNLTPVQTNNLVVLGKVWGFLKYHHPAVAKGNYNWDFELFRIAPKILITKNEAERNEILNTWIKGLGTFELETPSVVVANSVKYRPDFSWFITSGLSKGLVEQLQKIAIAQRREENYYVKLYDETTPIAIFKNEEPYASFKYPDAGYRLLALFKFWSIYEYFSPYKNIIDKPWGNILTTYVPKFVGATDELSYNLAVATLVAETQDSHSAISPYDGAFKNYYGAFKPNIEIVFINNQPVVNYSHDETVGISSLKKGDVIQSVNDVPVAKLIKNKLPFITASNLPTLYRNLAPHFLRTTDTLIRLSYIRDKKVEQTILKCFPYNKLNYRKTMPADSGFKMINNNIAYFHPGRLGTRLNSVMPLAIKAKAMIIDMRTYPRPTSFAWDIAKHLFSEPMDVARYTAGSTETPGLFTYMSDDYMKAVRIGETKADPFKGLVIVLINEETQSLAELSTMALSTRPNTLVVGSQTAGADGTVGMPVTFPGGLSTGFTQIGVYYPNGKETQRIGIVPNVEVKPTVKGIKDNKDEVLEKAISLIK